MNDPNYFNGIRVIESTYLVEDGTPYQRRRTWRERFFGRPWRPWAATCTVVPKVPSREVIMLNPGTMVVHPQTLRTMRAAFPKEPTYD